MEKQKLDTMLTDRTIDSSLSALQWVYTRSETLLHVCTVIKNQLEQFQHSNVTSSQEYCERWDVEAVPEEEYERIAQNRVVVETLKRAIHLLEEDVFYD